MKRITILGSTGSIGTSALAVARAHPDHFKIAGLSTNANIEELARQAAAFKPDSVCICDESAAKKFVSRYGAKRPKVYSGPDGLLEFIGCLRCDEVLVAISGASALEPLLVAMGVVRTIALANKEALVMAGPLVMERARRKKVTIIPVDSEQSAIWQCLKKEDARSLKTIYLTASGGPFRKLKKSAFAGVSIARTLAHPRWKMGRKITVDSANLMNKGLEFIEAMHLFGVSAETIKVVIHPEAVVHSMVEFVDGVVLAQLSVPDMRIPIQYAFSYPDRLANRLSRVDFCAIGALHFQRPDLGRFPCLGLAMRAAAVQGTMPAVMNAANEVCVSEFLKGRITFTEIPRIIGKVMDKHTNVRSPDIAGILSADSWARRKAGTLL